MLTLIVKLSLNLTKYPKALLQPNMISSVAAEDPVLFKEYNNKGIILLNRPKSLNAMNFTMVKYVHTDEPSTEESTEKLIKAQLLKWESDKDFVMIKGAGEKSFCAGGDIREVTQSGVCENTMNFFKTEYSMNNLIATYTIPYIALIDGITMGGGAGLSVHGKYVIATERTIFSMPETAIGLFPDIGASYFLTKLDGKLGLYLALTGAQVKGKDVLKCGIATHFIHSADLPKLENKLLEINNVQQIDSVLKDFCPTDNYEFSLTKYMDKINKTFSGNSVEEIFKNLKNDNSDWAKRTIEILNKMSPTSLKITFHQLNLGSKMTLQECLKMDHRMAIHSLEATEFKEGVRALIIDKDLNPNWNPKRLEEVTEDIIQFFFKKLPEQDELKL